MAKDRGFYKKERARSQKYENEKYVKKKIIITLVWPV